MNTINQMKLAQNIKETPLEAARKSIYDEIARQQLKAEIIQEVLQQISIQMQDNALPIIKELQEELLKLGNI